MSERERDQYLMRKLMRGFDRKIDNYVTIVYTSGADARVRSAN